jgi:hypothetical protein
MISQIEVERFSLTSSRPFDEVLASIKSAVGHPDMVEFAKTTAAARTFTELESTIRKGLGKTGLMLFMELDHGAVIRKATSPDKPRMVRLIMGNPLIMQEMAKRVRTLALTLQSPCSSTNVRTACLSVMTGWLAF